nr:MFS transporter [Anaerolineae bacterium]
MLKNLGRNNRLLMLALFVWALGEGLWFNNLRQLYLVELGAAGTQVGLALALESIVRAILPIPAGYLSDRLGPRRMMLASWILGACGPLLLAHARTWQMAVPGMIVYAMSGFAMPVISVFILRNTQMAHLPIGTDRALTTVFAVYPMGLIISPTIGGQIADRFDIQTTLWIAAAFFTLSTVIILFTRPNPSAESGKLPAPTRLLRNRRFIFLSVYMSLILIAAYTGFQLMPNYLQEIKGYSFGRIGLLFSLAAAGTTLLNLAAGRTPPRWNLLFLLGIYWFSLLAIWQAQSLAIVSIAFVATGSIYVIRTIAIARTANVVAPALQGLAFGALETVMAIALAASSGATGWLYALTPAHSMPFVISLAILPVLMTGWLACSRRLLQIPRLTSPIAQAGEAVEIAVSD